MGRNDIVKLVYILGKQHTGITWNGVPKDSLATNRTYNSAGEYYDDQGNRRYYGNESDNYTQHHLQLFYSHEFNENFFISTTLHYTRGTGFYEQYNYNKKFSAYGLSSQTVGGTTYKKSDFITRKKMDNEFLSLSLNVDRLFEGGKWTSGLNASIYNGLHFGRIAWSKYNDNIADDYEWYSNTGLKRELNFFSRVEKAVYDSRLNLYADLQARRISYDMQPFKVDQDDVVVGIAASGTTPYVVGAVKEARKRGILTGGITCNPDSPLAKAAQIPMAAVVGPEFVTGSTRMKSGTAEKLILNMISTAAMIRMGHVKGSSMVDMQLNNKKLVERGTRMIMEQTGIADHGEAQELLLKYRSVRNAVDNFKKRNG